MTCQISDKGSVKGNCQAVLQTPGRGTTEQEKEKGSRRKGYGIKEEKRKKRNQENKEGI